MGERTDHRVPRRIPNKPESALADSEPVITGKIEGPSRVKNVACTLLLGASAATGGLGLQENPRDEDLRPNDAKAQTIKGTSFDEPVLGDTDFTFRDWRTEASREGEERQQEEYRFISIEMVALSDEEAQEIRRALIGGSITPEVWEGIRQAWGLPEEWRTEGIENSKRLIESVLDFGNGGEVVSALEVFRLTTGESYIGLTNRTRGEVWRNGEIVPENSMAIVTPSEQGGYDVLVVPDRDGEGEDYALALFPDIGSGSERVSAGLVWVQKDGNGDLRAVGLVAFDQQDRVVVVSGEELGLEDYIFIFGSRAENEKQTALARLRIEEPEEQAAPEQGELFAGRRLTAEELQYLGRDRVNIPLLDGFAFELNGHDWFVVTDIPGLTLNGVYREVLERRLNVQFKVDIPEGKTVIVEIVDEPAYHQKIAQGSLQSVEITTRDNWMESAIAISRNNSENEIRVVPCRTSTSFKNSVLQGRDNARLSLYVSYDISSSILLNLKLRSHSGVTFMNVVDNLLKPFGESDLSIISVSYQPQK